MGQKRCLGQNLEVYEVQEGQKMQGEVVVQEELEVARHWHRRCGAGAGGGGRRG